MTELVHYASPTGSRTITLDSPHNRNALSRQLLTELFDALDRAEADEDARVVLIRSADRVFCSGADLSEAAGEGMEEGAKALVALQRRIVTQRRPVVTGVSSAMGGYVLALRLRRASRPGRGCVTIRRWRRTSALVPSAIPSPAASDRSAPEQKTRSADRISTTRASSSASDRSSASKSSVTSARDRALRLCGESRVIVRDPVHQPVVHQLVGHGSPVGRCVGRRQRAPDRRAVSRTSAGRGCASRRS